MNRFFVLFFLFFMGISLEAGPVREFFMPREEAVSYQDMEAFIASERPTIQAVVVQRGSEVVYEGILTGIRKRICSRFIQWPRR